MSDHNDKYTDPNTVHIPREMQERRRLLDPKDPPLPPPIPGGMEATHRFDILPSNPIHENQVWVEEEEYEEEESNANGERRGPSKRRTTKQRKSQHASDPSRQRYAGKCPSCGQGQISKVTVTGENYLHIYQEQQKQTLEQHLKMQNDPTRTKSREKILEENLQKQKDLEQTMRARDLQNQIVWWKQQRGLGQYEDAVVDATVEQLDRELRGIPMGLW